MIEAVPAQEIASELGRRVLKRTAGFADRFRQPEPGIVVLLYHRVGRKSASRVDLPEWLFEEQISRLVEGAGTVTLDEALERLDGAPPEGASPVALTFDDGTADFVDVALPILVRYRVPATLYVATEFVETRREFPQYGSPVSWDGLRDVLSTGLVTVGSHSHTHMLFDRTPPAQAAADLDRSVDLIGERLGVKAEHFAYPKALMAAGDCAREVAIRFRSAAVAGTHPNPYGRTDPLRLARSPLQIEDGLRYFQRKVSGGLRLEDDLRRFANRRRFVGLTS